MKGEAPKRIDSLPLVYDGVFPIYMYAKIESFKVFEELTLSIEGKMYLLKRSCDEVKLRGMTLTSEEISEIKKMKSFDAALSAKNIFKGRLLPVQETLNL